MDIANDLVAGAVGGVTGLVVGSPFDVVKVRMQAGLGQPTTWGTTMDIVKKEGVATFYRGLLPPIIGNVPMNALAFASYGWAARMLEEKFPQPPIPHHLRPTAPLEVRQKLVDDLSKQIPGLTLAQLDQNTTYDYKNLTNPNFMNLFLGGCFSGLVGTNLLTTIELLKIKEQNYLGGHVPSTWTIAKDLTTKHGARSLFQGWWSTAWREILSCGVYFGAYEWVKHLLRSEEWTPVVTNTTTTTTNNTNNNFALPPQVNYQYNVSYSIPTTLAAGSVAGITSWISTYPFDCIKTNIQTMPFEEYRKHGKIAQVTRHLVRQHGIAGLFSGIVPTLLRAAPVNAVTFYFYEQTLSLLKSMQQPTAASPQV